MKELSTVVTRKGQITVPIEIRRALGLRQGDRVALVMDKGEVRLRRVGSVVRRTAGMLKTDREPVSAEQLRDDSERAIAEGMNERMGG